MTQRQEALQKERHTFHRGTDGMYLLYVIKLIVVVTIIAFLLCATRSRGAQVQSPPPLPKIPQRLLSPKHAGQVGNTRMAKGVKAVTPKKYWLTWNEKEYTIAPVAFDVERKLSATSPWVKLATVNAPPFEITQYPGLFRVGVHWK